MGPSDDPIGCPGSQSNTKDITHIASKLMSTQKFSLNKRNNLTGPTS